MMYTAAARTYDVAAGQYIAARLRNSVLRAAAGLEHESTKSRLSLELSLDADLADRDLKIDTNAAAVRGLSRGLGVAVLISMSAIALMGLLATHVIPLLFGQLNHQGRFAVQYGLICVGSGAAGAMLSVTLRIRDASAVTTRWVRFEASKGDVALPPPDPEQVNRIMFREGFYRVIVGMLIASAVLFVMSSGLLSFVGPPKVVGGPCNFNDARDTCTAHQQSLVSLWFFWGGIGFLAGFNERWAFGLLRRGPQADQPPVSALRQDATAQTTEDDGATTTESSTIIRVAST